MLELQSATELNTEPIQCPINGEYSMTQDATVVWCVVRLHYMTVTPAWHDRRLLQFKIPQKPSRHAAHSVWLQPANQRRGPDFWSAWANGGRAGKPPVPACKIYWRLFHSLGMWQWMKPVSYGTPLQSLMGTLVHSRAFGKNRKLEHRFK